MAIVSGLGRQQRQPDELMLRFRQGAGVAKVESNGRVFCCAVQADDAAIKHGGFDQLAGSVGPVFFDFGPDSIPDVQLVGVEGADELDLDSAGGGGFCGKGTLGDERAERKGGYECSEMFHRPDFHKARAQDWVRSLLVPFAPGVVKAAVDVLGSGLF